MSFWVAWWLPRFKQFSPDDRERCCKNVPVVARERHRREVHAPELESAPVLR